MGTPQEHPSAAHGHGHDHTAGAPINALRIALALTATVFLAELIGAWWTHSLALATDAGHMFVDSVGLVIALITAYLMRRPRTDRYTWGLARAEIVSAALQAGILTTVCVIVTIESIARLINPPTVLAPQMAVIAAVGLLANIASLAVLHRQREHNLNMRAAFLEVLNDALGSVAVLIAAGVIALTNWQYADPIASLAIAALMAPRAVRMLATSVGILLDRTPSGLDLNDVRAHILAHEHVIDVHDLHITTIATGTVALSAHVTLPEDCFTNGCSITVLHELQDCLAKHFPISVRHCTFQLDVPEHRDHEDLHH